MKLALMALLLAQDSIIKVNVNLVQVDVTVTDRKGVHVEGLTAEDFEVFQDGKKQKVTSAVWVGQRPAYPDPKVIPATVAGPSGEVSRQLRKDQVRRTVVLYADDLTLSPAGLYYTQDAMTKFVEQNIEPGDLVALFRSSTGVSFLQQFSSDRRQLLAAIQGLRMRSWNGVDSLAAIPNSSVEDSGDPVLAEMARRERLRDEVVRRERQDMVTAGVLGSMQFLIQGLREMPGRKSVVMFSESVQLFDPPQTIFNPTMSSQDSLAPGAQGGQRARTLAALRALTDLANRNGVVLYTIDPRGLQTLGITAQDQPSTNVRRMQGQMQQRSFEFSASQDGLSVMAEETGGLFFKGTNDITAALRDAVNDQEGYYLVAFNPDDETFERTKGAVRFHKLEVKVKRGGLKVRYRKGFLGVTDEERLPETPSPLLAAMISPFRATEVPLKLTPILSLTGGQDGAGYLRTLLHMDASRFTYKDVPAEASDPDQRPWKATEVDVALFLFDRDGASIEKTLHTHQVKLRGNGFARAIADGLVEQLEMAIEKPGNYQLRAAILDKGSQLAGSATQFLPVPDIKAKRLESSHLIVSGEKWEKGEGERSSPALREFSAGEQLNYNLLIYNAKIAPDGLPKLETQLSIYREDKVIYRSARQTVSPPKHTAGEGLTLSGGLKVGGLGAAGEYTLEVAVRDLAAPKKRQYLVRSTEFTIAAATAASAPQN